MDEKNTRSAELTTRGTNQRQLPRYSTLPDEQSSKGLLAEEEPLRVIARMRKGSGEYRATIDSEEF